MAVHELKLPVIHRRLIEGTQQIVVVESVGFPGIEQNPVAVEND
jgi:hypothetical protein